VIEVPVVLTVMSSRHCRTQDEKSEGATCDIITKLAKLPTKLRSYSPPVMGRAPTVKAVSELVGISISYERGKPE